MRRLQLMRRHSMSSKLYSFAEIFSYKYDSDGKEVVVDKIIIPIIQRDYAQGRDSTIKVRERFLAALHNAVTKEPITLDFIYGDLEEKEFVNKYNKKELFHVLTPLDGQQRLTTLFLLHWYAAKKEKIEYDEYKFLKSFTYETRYTARDFCDKLVDFDPKLSGKLSDEIIDQNWFPLGWMRDPTIAGMLVVLDEIQKIFNNVDSLWSKLKEGAINFYFLPIKNMGLTDELYIKMNSRGKPLTAFENFKAELEQELAKHDKETAKKVIKKFDNEWTDLFWPYRNINNVIGNKFLNYFKFIYAITLYENDDTPYGKIFDEIEIVSRLFSKDNKNAKQNITKLESYFDCWVSLEQSPTKFLESILTKKHDIEKVLIEQSIDIFNDVITLYGSGFTLNRVVLIYAIITYLLKRDEITEADFIRRLRIVNNLIKNSTDEITDSLKRMGGNRMPAILKQTKKIIELGEFEEDITINFNEHQLREEKLKMQWLIDNEDKKHTLYKLEDHPLLYGQTQILGLENIELTDKFYELFNCDYDLVNMAMLTIGDFGQVHRNWRLQLGAKTNKGAWEKLFHRSGMVGFENTQTVLKTILSTEQTITNEYLKEIINEYIEKCEVDSHFDWRYYFIKYDVFRPDRFGVYCLDDIFNNRYVMRVIYAAKNISQKSYQPYLAQVDKTKISTDAYGEYSIINNKIVKYTKSSIVIEALEDKSLIEEIPIAQNDEGIDVEDRIIKLSEYLKTKMN